MSHVKKLAGQTAIYGLPTIIARVLNYFLVPLYTRVFATAEYGVVTDLYAYIAFFAVVLTYGMETAFFRFVTKNKTADIYNTASISLIVSSLVFMIGVSAFAQPIANAMHYSLHPEYIIWFALILGLDAIRSIPFASLRQQNKAKRFAFIKSMDIATNIGFNLFFIVLCPYVLEHTNNTFVTDLIHLVYNENIGIGYVFISNLLASAISILLLMPEFSAIRWHFDRKLWKQMFIYAFPVMVWGMANMINETFDRAVMKYLIPDSENPMSQLGIYGACYKLSIIMTLFVQAFKYAAEPFFFNYAKNQDSRQVYADVMTYFVIACSFIFLGVMMYFDVALLFIGPEYRAGAYVVPILLLANMFLGIFYNLSIWYKLTDRTKFGAYISLVGAAVTIVLNIILVPVMGYKGAAWTTFIAYFLIMVLSYLFGQKYYPIPYKVTRIIFYIAFVVFLYIMSTVLTIENHIIKHTLHTLYLGLFGFVVYALEIKNKTVGKIS